MISNFGYSYPGAGNGVLFKNSCKREKREQFSSHVFVTLFAHCCCKFAETLCSVVTCELDVTGRS